MNKLRIVALVGLLSIVTLTPAASAYHGGWICVRDPAAAEVCLSPRIDPRRESDCIARVNPYVDWPEFLDEPYHYFCYEWAPR